MERDNPKKPAEQGNKNFVEQQAPEKNTDNAYVKVGTDGQPELPREEREKNKEEGSLTHR
jgi:hypothetical protein